MYNNCLISVFSTCNLMELFPIVSIQVTAFSERVIPSCLHQPGPEKSGFESSGFFFLFFLSFQSSVNYFGMLSMYGI